jgi:hypothetical protein
MRKHMGATSIESTQEQNNTEHMEIYIYVQLVLVPHNLKGTEPICNHGKAQAYFTALEPNIQGAKAK